MKLEISNGWHLILKWIAVFSMIIGNTVYFFADVLSFNDTVIAIGNIIGSLSLPLFAFLLVEGFYKTQNRIKHLVSLIILAIISEVPSDIFQTMHLLDWQSQNVVFSLTVAYLLMMFCDMDHRGIIEKNIIPIIKNKYAKKEFVIKLIVLSIRITALGIAILGAIFANLYNGYHSILLCFMLYLSRKNENIRPVTTAIAISLYLILQLGTYGFVNSVGILAVILLVEWVILTRDYFQRKSSKTQLRICKWMFPVHMILLIAVRLMITW